jgi:hypothetical protein
MAAEVLHPAAWNTLPGVFSADEAFDSPVLNKRVDLSRLFA